MEPLLTTKEVCEVLRCHRNSVRNWVRQWKLAPAATVGRAYRFQRSEVERFMREHARPLVSTKEIAEIKEAVKD